MVKSNGITKRCVPNTKTPDDALVKVVAMNSQILKIQSLGMLTETEKAIITKMLRHSYIGGKRTSEENIPKGMPRDASGKIKEALKNLIKQGYVIPKKTRNCIEVSLDSHRLKEIHDILRG
jgi:hypothetical protein